MGDFPYVIRVFPVRRPTVRWGFFFPFSYLYVFGKESTPTAEVSEVTKLYTEPLVVTNTDTVIRAIAIAEGTALSDVSSTEPLGVFASAAKFSANGTIWAQGVDNNEKKDFVEDALISMETSTPDP
jgi:hypothetical protein